MYLANFVSWWNNSLVYWYLVRSRNPPIYSLCPILLVYLWHCVVMFTKNRDPNMGTDCWAEGSIFIRYCSLYLPGLKWKMEVRQICCVTILHELSFTLKGCTMIGNYERERWTQMTYLGSWLALLIKFSRFLVDSVCCFSLNSLVFLRSSHDWY